jgi:hypothetical protein
VLTFARLVQLTEANIAFAQRIALLRTYYLEVAPELRPYLTVLPARRPPAPDAAQLLLTVAGMVGFVNSAIVGAAAGMLVAAASGSLAVSLAIGLPVGAAALLLHLRSQHRARAESSRQTMDALAVAVPA